MLKIPPYSIGSAPDRKSAVAGASFAKAPSQHSAEHTANWMHARANGSTVEAQRSSMRIWTVQKNALTSTRTSPLFIPDTDENDKI